MLNLLHDWCTRSSLYGVMLRKSVRGQLRSVQQDNWPPVTWNTRSLIAGLYQAYDKTLTVAEIANNLSDPKMDPQTVCLHTFDFIRDLNAIGDNNSRRLARRFINHWIDNNSQLSDKPWKSPGWNLDILGYRLCNWLGFYEFFANSANETFRKKLVASIGQQYRFLKRRQLSLKDPVSRIRALKGLIYACCALPGEQNHLAKVIVNLRYCLNAQLDENFNPKLRHPGTLVLLMRDLIDLRLILKHFYAGQIDFLNEYIIRLAPIVRHLRHGDGFLSSFTGDATQRLDAFCQPVLGDGLIDMVLSLADSRAALPDPIAMGYVKCSGKPGFLLINTRPSNIYLNLQDWQLESTGVLDFEWSERATRLLTRGDVSVFALDSEYFMRYNPQKNQMLKSKFIHEQDHGFFSSDYQVNQSPTKVDPCGAVLQAKRDLYISPKGDIKGEDTFILSQPGKVKVRFLAPAGLEWKVTSEKESALLCGRTQDNKKQKPEYLKRFIFQGPAVLETCDVFDCNALCVAFCLNANQQVSVKWAISPS